MTSRFMVFPLVDEVAFRHEIPGADGLFVHPDRRQGDESGARRPGQDRECGQDPTAPFPND
jgi:hypothetical protein